MLTMSCYSIVSEYSENEELLDYKYYINEGWETFEVVNLSDTLLIDQHADYYDLALNLFNIAIQAIESEFSLQQFISRNYICHYI